MRRSILFCNAVLALLALLTTDARAVTIDWTPVGNPGNANDPVDGDALTNGVQNFGAVPYAYQIDKYDVTNSQYAEFLNAKDPTGANALSMWNSNMANATFAGITLNLGNANGSKYSVISGDGNHPVNYVPYYDALRFTNWLNNGQGNGDTETGAYTLGQLGPPGSTPIHGNSITRNEGATVVLPNDNEWYKAAYYNPGTNSYFQFPTSSNTTPFASGPTATPNSANYNNVVGHLTDVGAYTGTTSPYGAFDMGGNVFQWIEDLGSLPGFRGARGGSFNANFQNLESLFLAAGGPSGASPNIGFRVANIPNGYIPEPSSLVLAALGFIGLAAYGVARARKGGSFAIGPRPG